MWELINRVPEATWRWRPRGTPPWTLWWSSCWGSGRTVTLGDVVKDRNRRIYCQSLSTVQECVLSLPTYDPNHSYLCNKGVKSRIVAREWATLDNTGPKCFSYDCVQNVYKVFPTTATQNTLNLYDRPTVWCQQ